MAGNNYANQLFDAMSIVALSTVKSYHYDETIEAVVVDASGYKEGKYKVEYTGGRFEAYGSGETYYEKDTVYVTVPKGDFTQLKFIIGRKVDVENAPGTTFNFRMPFDDFIALRNLTNQVSPVKTNANGGAKYIANHPNHGTEVESSSAYTTALTNAQNTLSGITAAWSNKMSYFSANCEALKLAFNNVNYETVEVEVKENIIDATGHSVVVTTTKTETHQKTISTGESMGSSSYLYGNKTYRDAILDIIQSNVTINGNWLSSNAAWLSTWNSIKTIIKDYIEKVICTKKHWTETLEKPAARYPTTYDGFIPYFAWDDADLNIFLTEIESRYGVGHSSLMNSYRTEYNALATIQGRTIENLAQDSGNLNLLWSWHDSTGNVLVETKLGVSIDVTTLLGDYSPIDGRYGIRMVLMGTTKPSEEVPTSESVTETVYFTNEGMYGNTYGYYSPYTQLKIFDLSNFLTLTHIDIYFWQDHQYHLFRDYNANLIPYQYEVKNGNSSSYVNVEPNIIIANLQVLLGLTPDEATQDRVILYTHDSSDYGIPADKIEDVEAVLWARDNAEKTLRVAWIHINPADGTPVLVDHEKKLDNNDNDINSLQYWNAKIYWYNYQYGHPLNNGIEAEKYGGVNWKPKPFDLEDQTEEFTEYDSSNAHFQCKVTPSTEKIREKYKAVIVAGNAPYRSDVLQFNNLDTTASEGDFDSLYEVVFRFLKEVPSSDGSQSTIVQDDSIGNFFVYDENNNVINDDNGVSYAAVNYYVQIWVRNNETGDYSPATLDDDNGISEIQWKPFGNNSMVTTFTEPTELEMENSELTPIKGSLSEAQKRLIKSITRRFTISRRWIMRYGDNKIAATVRRKNKLYSLEKELLFGQSGTMGSPYTVILQLNEPENGEMVYGGKFTITARVFERGLERPNSKYKFMWQILSPTYVTSESSTSLDGSVTNVDDINSLSGTFGRERIGSWWKSTPKYESAGGYLNNRISGYIRNNMPLIIKCIVDDCADYTISTTQGFALVNTPKLGSTSVYFANNLNAQCPDRVEYKSDGSAPLADAMEFSVTKKRVPQLNQRVSQCGYLFQDKYSDEDDNLFPLEIWPEWKLYCYTVDDIAYNYQENPATGKKERTGVNYIILKGGPNPGNNSPSMMGCLSLKPVIIRPVTITELVDDDDTTIPSRTTYVLSTSNNYTSPTGYGPDGPAEWYWDDAYETDYYCVLQWKQTVTVTNVVNNSNVTESVDYWFRQAVPLTLNVYSSSLVNNWNGELLIDYENNAIMSKMMAAGSKNRLNQFTGVMMGDWADKGDTSLDTPGMYGFAAGRQVFGLRTNGTGFIGKSGKGQIRFDGNYALISNADKTCYINLDPITYGYKGDDIRIKNYRGYSLYFLYAESEATTKTDGSDLHDFFWANKIIKSAVESGKDIFAVDPNNGILTTGGIYAKYGRLGKYLLLNDSGITYKQHYNPKTGVLDTINNDLTTAENNDIIYIGQERRRNGTLIPIDATDRRYDCYYWSSDSYGSKGSTLSGNELSEGNSSAGASIEVDGKKLGRYIIWAGNTIGDRAYPNFGVEHDGTVHLSNAYVQGEIHASALIIGDEDYEESQRSRSTKTFYTKIDKNSDLKGCNPALLKDKPPESARLFLYGKGGTCHNFYGDWLRPGDTWYIRSNKLKKVTVIIGKGGTIDNPEYTNPYAIGFLTVDLKSYGIDFPTGKNFEYRVDTTNNTKAIWYTGGGSYTLYSVENGSYTILELSKSIGSNLNLTALEATLATERANILNYKYNNKTIKELKKLYDAAVKTYARNNSAANKTAKDTAYNNYMTAYRESLVLECSFKTDTSKYNAVFSKLKAWSNSINEGVEGSSSISAITYDATELVIAALDNQIVKETQSGSVEIPQLNLLETDTITDDLTVSTLMSYTQLVWEGILAEENNHRWYGTWTDSNILPSGATVGSRIEESLLNNNYNVNDKISVTTDEDFLKAGNAGFVHPQMIEKTFKDKSSVARRYSAPPGWRVIGDIDSDSIWDALTHATLSFNSALRGVTSTLTTNLQTTFNLLIVKMNGDQEAVLKEINKLRSELTNMLTMLLTNINAAVYDSVSAIRGGMDPITFFDDGNCYVFLSKTPIDSNIQGVGTVPAGLTIVLLPEQSGDTIGSTLYLNSKRMGFYRTFKSKLGTQDITVNIPLMSYYNGSMALAGSLLFGMDYNNFIRANMLDAGLTAADIDAYGQISDARLFENSPGATDLRNNGTSTIYKNYLDGPNCRIVLGNGAIVIDGLDNGLNLDGEKNKHPFPGAPKEGRQEAYTYNNKTYGTPYVYIGYSDITADLTISTNPLGRGVVRIGRRNAGLGFVSIADYDFTSTKYSSSELVLRNLETDTKGKILSTLPTTANKISVLTKITKSKSSSSDSKTYTFWTVVEDGSGDYYKKYKTKSDTVTLSGMEHGNEFKIGTFTVDAADLDVDYNKYKITNNEITLDGDLLAITLRTTGGKYTGIGIIGADKETGYVDEVVVLGPIRAQKFSKYNSGLSLPSDIISFDGYNLPAGYLSDETKYNTHFYETSKKYDTNAWLVGWNFYGHDIYVNRMYAKGHLLIDGDVKVKESRSSSNYINVATEVFVIQKLYAIRDEIIGGMNINFKAVHDSFEVIEAIVNGHKTAIAALAENTKGIASGVLTLSNGVASAIAAATNALKMAGEALGEAKKAIALSIVSGALTWETGVASWSNGCGYIALRTNVNPYTNNGKGTPKDIFDSYVKVPTTTHCHSVQMEYIKNSGVLKFTIYGPRTSQATGSEEDSNAYYTNNDEMRFNLATTLDTRYLLPADLILSKSWEDFYWTNSLKVSTNVESVLSIKSHDTEKVPFDSTSTKDLRINFLPVMLRFAEAYTYDKATIDNKVLEAFKKGWNDGWDKDYISAKKQGSDLTKFYVYLSRPAYNGPGKDKLTIAAKPDGDPTATQMLEIKLEYYSNRYIRVNRSSGGTSNDTNPLLQTSVWFHHGEYTESTKKYDITIDNNNDKNAADHVYITTTLDASAAWTAGAKDAVLNGSADKWYLSKNEISFLWKYNNQTSETNKHTIEPRISISSYDKSTKKYTITKQLYSYVYTGTRWEYKTQDCDTQDLDASTAYEAGWRDAYDYVSITKSKIEYPAPYSSWTQPWSNTTDTYNAGWGAAAGKFYRWYDTVYGPSATVGQSKSYTASVSDNHSVSTDTHRAEVHASTTNFGDAKWWYWASSREGGGWDIHDGIWLGGTWAWSWWASLEGSGGSLTGSASVSWKDPT